MVFPILLLDFQVTENEAEPSSPSSLLLPGNNLGSQDTLCIRGRGDKEEEVRRWRGEELEGRGKIKSDLEQTIFKQENHLLLDDSSVSSG